MTDLRSLPQSVQLQIQKTAADVLNARAPKGSKKILPSQDAVVKLAAHAPELLALIVSGNPDISSIRVADESMTRWEETIQHRIGPFTWTTREPVYARTQRTRIIQIKRDK